MATVIKSTLGTRQALPIAFNFADVSQQALNYIDEVQAQASAIIADAKRQADAVRRKAEDEGKAAALSAMDQVLEEKVGQKMESLRPALEKVVSELADSRHAWLRHWEQRAVHLSAKIAQRVIRRELSAVPQIKLDLIREA